MTLHVINSDTTSPIIADTANDVWLVREDVTIATMGWAIDATSEADDREFLIAGHLVAEDAAGISLGAGDQSTVVVGATGSITSNVRGIEANALNVDSVKIRNAGEIYGDEAGVFIDASALDFFNDGTISGANSLVSHAMSNKIVNNGTMNGQLAITSQGSAYITNAGTIHGGIYLETLTGSTNYVLNTGTMIGDLGVAGLAGNEVVANAGMMQGTVLLGAGNDKFFNQGVQQGGIDFGTGDDALTLSEGSHVYGNVLMGDGNDRVEIFGEVTGPVQGMAGNDLYLVHNSAVTLVETSYTDTDWVIAYCDWRLGFGFESLALGGDGDFDGYGNWFGNSINGNAGDNRLFGGEGDDVLDGFDGIDRLNGGQGTDTGSYFNAGRGVIFDLAKGIARSGPGDGDVLISIENIEGSHYDDRLLGDDGANRISAIWGNDRLDGRGGDDWLRGDAGVDTFVFGKGYGRDTIADFTLTGDQADVIDLTRMTGIDSLRDLLRNHRSVEGDDVIFTFDDGSVLVLDGLAGQKFQASHFLI